MPPPWPQSGCSTSMTWASRISRTSHMVRSRSPVARGTGTNSRSLRITSILPGTQASSKKSRSSGFRYPANCLTRGGGRQLWASTITAPSGPTFSRASRTLCTRASTSPGVPAQYWPPPGPILIAFGLGYIQTLSRTGPPSRRYTGTPQSLPAISHSAMSMAEIVCTINPPPRRLRCALNIRCQRCSVRVGFSPMIISASDSARAQATRVSILLISPHPVTPIFVSILTYPLRPTGIARSALTRISEPRSSTSFDMILSPFSSVNSERFLFKPLTHRHSPSIRTSRPPHSRGSRWPPP